MSNLEWVIDPDRYGTCVFCKEGFKKDNVATKTQFSGLWVHPKCTHFSEITIWGTNYKPLFKIKAENYAEIIRLLTYNPRTRPALEHIRLDNYNLFDLDLSELDFSRAKFCYVNFHNCDFSNSVFTDSSFVEKVGYPSHFYNCRLENTIFPKGNNYSINPPSPYMSLTAPRKFDQVGVTKFFRSAYDSFCHSWGSLGNRVMEDHEKRLNFRNGMILLDNFMANCYDASKLTNGSDAYVRSVLVSLEIQ